MKPNLSYLRIITSVVCITVAVFSVFAQVTQPGVVQEYNEKAKKTPLAGVELNVRNANNTISAKDGSFSLQFKTLKPGDRVTVRRIEKLGYEIFNKEALEQWNLNPNTPFVIILCRSDKFKAIRDNIKRGTSENYYKQYKNACAQLTNLKEELKINEDEYNKHLAEIIDIYESKLDDLDNYIDKFSRIDLSEASALEQEAIELAQNGNFDEAIAKYEKYNATGKLIDELKKRNELINAKDLLAEKLQTINSNISDLYKSAENEMELLNLEGDLPRFKVYLTKFVLIAESDTTNFQWQLKMGRFIKRNLNQNYGIPTIKQLIPRINQKKEFANLAIKYFLRALRLSNESNSNPDVTYLIHRNLAQLYAQNYRHQEALHYYDFQLKYEIEKYGHGNQSIATTLVNIGKEHKHLYDNQKALEYYFEALNIHDTISDADIILKARILDLIGDVYNSLEDYDNALKYKINALSIYERFSDHNSLEHSWLISANITRIYEKSGDTNNALEYKNKEIIFQNLLIKWLEQNLDRRKSEIQDEIAKIRAPRFA